jgi:hypothetical protein
MAQAAAWQLPAGPDEVAGVAVRDALQIILMFRFRFPESSGRLHLGHHLAGPETRGIHIRNRFFRDMPLLVGQKIDARTIRQATVIALTIQGCGVMNLKEEFEQVPIADARRIEDDLDPFCVGAMIAISRVRNVAPGISDPR